MAKFKWRKNVSITRVISKIVATALSMWVGSKIMSAVATSMTNEAPVFYQGLNFLGFSGNGSHLNGSVSSTGVVSVIGLVGGATIILEFVQVSF